jgi:hypothetical protein
MLDLQGNYCKAILARTPLCRAGLTLPKLQQHITGFKQGAKKEIFVSESLDYERQVRLMLFQINFVLGASSTYTVFKLILAALAVYIVWNVTQVRSGDDL